VTTQYTPILKLALPVTGELSGTWGTVVNDNITSMVEQAVAGLSTINTWTSDAHTLTTADGTSSEARCAMLVAQNGAGLTGVGTITCPAASKLYVLKNATSYLITLKASGTINAGSFVVGFTYTISSVGTTDFTLIGASANTIGVSFTATGAGTGTGTATDAGVAVPAGDTAFLFCNGTSVNACVTTIVNGHISGNLTVDGNTTLGNATSDTITATARFNTDLLPSTDNARDLGSTANSWRTLYCETSVIAANITISGNTISSTDTNGNITLAPNGTGDVQLDADTIRVGDSGANVTITSNGAGDLILNTNSGTNSGSITIEDGANGNIALAPNGTGQVTISTALDLTTLEVTNIKAKDGSASITLADSTGVASFTANPILSGGTANGVVYLNASKVATSGSALTFDGSEIFKNSGGTIQNNDVRGSAAAGTRLSAGGTLGVDSFDLFQNAVGGYVFNRGNTPLIFGANNAEKMRLTSTGTLNIVGAGTAGSTQAISFNGSTPVDTLVTDSSGRVGIGTSSPNAKLTVGDSSGAVLGIPTTASFYGTSSISSSVGTVGLFSTEASAVGVGPTLTFGGKSGNSFSPYPYAFIQGCKASATAGDYSGFLRFWTVPSDGGSPIERLRIDSSGNLGLGVTPSAWGSISRAMQFQNGVSIFSNTSGLGGLGNNVYSNPGTGDYYIATGFATRYYQYNGTHVWNTAASGTAGATTSITSGVAYSVTTLGSTTLGEWQAFFSALTGIPSIGQTVTATATGTLAGGATVTQIAVFTQAMTLDASGNLGVGQTNPSTWLVNGVGIGSGSGDWGATIYTGTSSNGYLCFADGTTTLDRYRGYISYAHATNAMLFATDATERARITSGGYFKASNDGTYFGSAGAYHEMRTNQSGTQVAYFTHSNAGGDVYGLNINFTASSPDNNSNFFLECRDSTTARCYIYSDGDLANHDGVYGTISDQKLKQDIIDAGSQWADLKAIRFRKYRMKSDVLANPDAPYLLGVVAQELEQVSPGLVDEHPDMETVEVTDEDGNVTQTQQPTGTTTKSVKTSILLMKAAVALQEAMARIEQLEAKVAALEAN
jgi:hypothetical protein